MRAPDPGDVQPVEHELRDRAVLYVLTGPGVTVGFHRGLDRQQPKAVPIARRVGT